MIERIIAGIVIGFILGLAISISKNADESSESKFVGIMGLISVAFIGSSFVFGPIFGAMAIGEIAIGYWISSSIFSTQKV